MQKSVEQTTWAKKLEIGLDAITFLEINDPTKMINEAVDSLFENTGENESACKAEIENIGSDAYRNIALARLQYKKFEKYETIIPHEFLYPQDNNDEIVSTEEFNSLVFQLWSNVNTSLIGLEEAMTCLRADISNAIRQRVEMPDFANEFQNWMDRTNEELHSSADENRKNVDIDDTITNAVQSGAASSIIFLLIVTALVAPLFSMCSQN